MWNEEVLSFKWAVSREDRRFGDGRQKRRCGCLKLIFIGRDLCPQRSVQ
jgi:hypothetical protein